MSRKALCISFGAVLALAFMVLAPATRADDWDQASQFTFNRPVQLPENTVLPAGTYWFVLTDGGVSPAEMVQIFNKDRTQVLATMNTISTIRPEMTDHGELIFAEQPGKQAVALISWFYPNRLAGHEFVYSPREEERLSKNEQITVMAKPVEIG
jgi:hypothetical protein